MAFDANKINKFWDWFKTISDDLLDHENNQTLIYQLDDWVNRLGAVSWEIGPWENDCQFFALSPNLDPDMLTFTQQAIALAPACKGWHFLPSKPPKEWNGIWQMRNERDIQITVDTEAWQYILYQFDDGVFSIDISITPIDGNQETKKQAVDIALTGYLGEEDYMLLINDIQIIDEFEDAIKSKATLLKDIKQHVKSLNGLKKKAYLLGSRLINQGYDFEVIRARMDKEGVPEEMIEQVILNLAKQVVADVSEESKPFFNLALIKIGIGILLAIISAILIPGQVYLPIGLIGTGIAAAYLFKPK